MDLTQKFLSVLSRVIKAASILSSPVDNHRSNSRICMSVLFITQRSCQFGELRYQSYFRACVFNFHRAHQVQLDLSPDHFIPQFCYLFLSSGNMTVSGVAHTSEGFFEEEQVQLVSSQEVYLLTFKQLTSKTLS